MNSSAFIYGISCLLRPSLLRPSLVYEQFSDIPIDISRALNQVTKLEKTHGQRPANIQALVIDKDNCIAEAESLELCPRYNAKWKELRDAFPGAKVVIVSNSSGSSADVDGEEAMQLSNNLGAEVLLHKQKKPACYPQIMHYLKQADIRVTSSSEIVVIGDRLFTDVLMANLMGSHSIWLIDGAKKDSGVLSRFEKAIYNLVLK